MKCRGTDKFKKQFYVTFSNKVHALSELILSLISKVSAVGFRHQNYGTVAYIKWHLLGYTSPSLPGNSKHIAEFLVT